MCANGVVQVEPDHQFRVQIANFGEYPVRDQKGHVVAEFLPHTRAVLESKITIGEDMGVQERKAEDLSDDLCDAEPAYAKGQETESCPGPEKPDSERRIEPPQPDVNDLDLSNVPELFGDKFRPMLKKYSRMWDGTLSEIKTTVHRVDLVPDTMPIAQAPYRGGRKAREI